MTSNPPIASMRPTRRTRATHVPAMAIACLALASRRLPAQSPYSALVGLGVGAVPAEHRHPGTAVSIAVFRRVGSALDLGFEVGYQHFGSSPEHYVIGHCPFVPAGACVGDITATARESGDLSFVGPVARLRPANGGTVRPFLLAGLARYTSSERRTGTYRDDRGVTVPVLETLYSEREFGGAGASAAIGIEAGRPGTVRWMLTARVHGAVGGMSGELASVSGWTVTAGLVLP